MTIVWAIAILGLPFSTIYEGIQIQYDTDYRLGWVHFVAPLIACFLPILFVARWPLKIGLIIMTPIICVAVEMVTVVVDVMYFNGLSGIH